MSPVRFFAGFCRYAWFRSGPILLTSFIPLLIEIGLVARYPHMMLPTLLSISLLVIISLLSLLTCLTFSEQVDMGTSAFPKQLFLLPVSSKVLAMGPILLGALLMGVLGLGFGLGVLGPNMGFRLAFWPAIYLAGTLATIQAISWSTLPGTARVLVGILPLMALAAGPMAIFLADTPPWIIETIYGGLFIGGILGGFRAVDRARKHDYPSRQTTNEVVKPLPAFRNAMDAQVWLEVKRNGMVVSVLNGFFVVALVVFVGIGVFGGSETISLNGISLSQPALIGAAGLLLMSGLLCSTASGSASASDNVTKTYELQPFLALRPLSTNDLIQAKMRMAGIVLSRCVGASVVGALILLLVPSPANPDHQITLVPLLHAVSWKQVGLFALVYSGFVIGCFKGMISGIWNGIGKLPTVVKFLVTGLLPPLAVMVGIGGPVYLISHQELVPKLIATVPYVIGFLLFVKLMVTTIAVRKLRTYALVEDRTMAVWAAVWIGMGAAFALGMVLNGSVSGKELAWLAALQFLTLPFGRVALTPILVRANRHR